MTVIFIIGLSSHVLMVPSVKSVKEHALNVLLVIAVTMEHLDTFQPLAVLVFSAMVVRLSVFLVLQVNQSVCVYVFVYMYDMMLNLQ